MRKKKDRKDATTPATPDVRSLRELSEARKASESPCVGGWNYHVFSLASLNCTMCGASR